MNRIDDIYNAYYEAENFIAHAALNAPHNTEYWNTIQEKTQFAFFILLFAQFDGFVTEIIEEDHGLDNYSNMGFMHKLGIVLDNKNPDYRKIEKWYAIRCDIAHGRPCEKIPADMDSIQQFLKACVQTITRDREFMPREFENKWR